MLDTEKSPGWDTGAKNNHHTKSNGSKHTSQDCIEQFRLFARQKGFELPAKIIADGKVHRFGPNNAYAYCLHRDGVPNGWAQNWRQGATRHQWKANGRKLNHEERERADVAIKAAKAEREADKAELHKKTALEARRILDHETALAPSGHSYLVKKGIRAHGARIYTGNNPKWRDCLVISVMRGDEIVGLQFIAPEKRFKGGRDKDFLPGTQKKGAYFVLGVPDGKLCICEGFATGATIHEETGHAVAVAFDAGNLLPVAKAFEGFPGEVIICADNDASRVNGLTGIPENIGLIKATEAAGETGAKLAVPSIDGDFNDLCQLDGGGWHVQANIDRADYVQTPGEGEGNAASAGAEAKSDAQAWRDPQSLPSGLPAVAPFDFALLPENTRAWGDEIATMMQSPPDFLGVDIMVGLGAVIGRKIGIRPKEHGSWTVTANQWGVTIGRPSTKKSPSMEAALAPLEMLAARANKEFKEALKHAEIAIKINATKAKITEEQAKKALRNNPLADVASFFTVEDFEEPICKRYKTNDANEASLGAILVENPNGVLVVRDEIVALFRNFDREDKAGEREFFLTGWNGNSPHTIDRIVRGKNLHIPGVCISLLGTTQPGKIARYVSEAVRGGYGDDGMLQRMQFMVWPDISPDWQDIDRPINKAVKHRAFDVYKRLDELDPIAIGAAQDLDYDGEPEGLPYLRWTPAALEIFRDWHKRLQLRIRGDIHPAMEAHLGKYSKLVPSVALICHLADGKTGDIGEEEVLRALAWSEYLETHAKRVYASVTMPEVDAAKAVAAKLKSGALTDGFTRRDILQKEWSRLTDQNEVQRALDMLVDFDWLSCVTTQTGGRPRTTYSINPRLRP